MHYNAPYRVLVVEDNPGDADLVAHYLSAASEYRFDLVHAETLQEARSRLSTMRFDVVIADLNLSDSNGIETLKSLRNVCDDIAYVVISGDRSFELRGQLLRVGVQEFIGKHELSSALVLHTMLALERQRLQIEQLQIQKLAMANPDATIVVDIDGVVQYVNESALRLFGYTREDFLGERLGFSVKEGTTTEIEVRRGPHDMRTAEMHVVNITWNGRPASLAAIRDTTQQKQMTRHLQQTQKMEALGRMAGGIAHDFNNILSIIGGNLRLARHDISSDHPAQESMGEIERAVERATGIVGQILIYGRQKEPKHEAIQLEPLMEEAIRFLRVGMPMNIAVDTEYAAHLAPAQADANQILQILINLGINAIHAMRETGGHLQFRLSRYVAEHSTMAQIANLDPGHYLLIEVIDNGHGMDQETQQRIFDPFFTTKAQGEGTGLGLSVVHGIVREHGGVINVYSELGRGTVFKVYLPASESKRYVPVTHQSAPDKGEHEHILYVDDDQSLARLMVRMLKRLEYRVTSFDRPQEAIAAFRAAPDQFDAAILDRSMPLLDGPALAQELLELRPDLPIVMVTGYIRPGDIEHVHAIGVRELMLKPDAFKQMDKILLKIFQTERKEESQYRRSAESGTSESSAL